MDDSQRRVDAIRGSSSELENHLIDEFASGRLTRREFVRRGTVVGMSIPMLSFLISACGGDDEGAATGTGEQQLDVRPGGTLRTGIIAPAGELDPITVADEGGLAVLGQSGEYLTWSDEKLELQPRLAESWEPNEDGSVWTFKVRQGVTFHDGRPMTAEDVAATMNRLADPDVGSNALSAFGGVLSPGAVEAVDDSTVQFTLDAPNGNFPYLVSSDNYNAIVLPPTSTAAGTRRSSERARGSWRSTRPRSASRTSRTPTTGIRTASRTPTAARSSSTPRSRPASSRCRGTRSTSSRTSP